MSSSSDPFGEQRKYLTEKGYSIGVKLGSGAFGVVFKARDPHNEDCVVKIINCSGNAKHLEATREEYLRHAVHNSRNIVKCWDWFVVGKMACIVAELCDGGHLGAAMKNVSIPAYRARRWLKDFLLGISAVHSANLIHRDIKPENLLLTADDSLKIGDLGIASLIGDQFTVSIAEYRTTLLGNTTTFAFMAPELFSEKYKRRVDIFSGGMIIYCAVMGLSDGLLMDHPSNAGRQIPFGLYALLQPKADIDALLFSGEQWSSTDGQFLKKWLSKMLIIDSEDRWTANTLLAGIRADEDAAAAVARSPTAVLARSRQGSASQPPPKSQQNGGCTIL